MGLGNNGGDSPGTKKVMLRNTLPELCSFFFPKALNFLRYACRLFLHDQLQQVKKYFKHYGSHSRNTRADQKQSINKNVIVEDFLSKAHLFQNSNLTSFWGI